jgi:hypothetical protein
MCQYPHVPTCHQSHVLFNPFTVILVLVAMELVAHDMHANEMHAYGMHAYECMPMTCACEMHAHERGIS